MNEVGRILCPFATVLTIAMTRSKETTIERVMLLIELVVLLLLPLLLPEQ